MANKATITRELNEWVQIGEHRIPKRPYYKWKFIKLLPLDTLYTTYSKHHRLSVFVEKGLECVHPDCSRVGKYIMVTEDDGGGIHTDLVDKEFKLMNVDHIIPLHPKTGPKGSNTMANKQPMCEYHNSLKSNKLTPY